MKQTSQSTSGEPETALPWLLIRVELVSGGPVGHLWPRPGRLIAASPLHTYAALATAIDEAFARWDRAHLHQFWLPDGSRVIIPEPGLTPRAGERGESLVSLAQLQAGNRFIYDFDFGASWLHLCTIGEDRIDPTFQFGRAPRRPTPYRGWG